MKGVPRNFTIPESEMYDEPYGVPTPDLLLLDETWKDGSYFRSGCLWYLGKGQVFYFRPGHETYNVYKQEVCLKIILNAIRHLGKSRAE